MARTPSVRPSAANPRRQLEAFLSRYSPDIEALARAVLQKMEQRLPGATELVYDNYNALVIGFGPTERPSDCPFSIGVYARWVNLYFLDGIQLSDPDGLLKGSGNRVRHIRLEHADDLDRAGVQTLIGQAIRLADPPMPTRAGPRTIVIRAVSPRKRPRRPTA
jgi:hypothetical protein